MDQLNLAQQQPPRQLPLPDPTASMHLTEDSAADVDEPPDEPIFQPAHLNLQPAFGKADPALYNRRESLLTRQLHSETEHTDEDDVASRAPPRALSTQSTWSNPSVASTAELTSDDGLSMASPAISPPLPPTTIRTLIPITDKPLSKEPRIIEHEKLVATSPERSVEAGLGRKRCISFACGNKKPPTSHPVQQPAPMPEPQGSASPPKRKCALKFVCPTRSSVETKPAGKPVSGSRRPMSPAPRERKPYKPHSTKAHRGSDSTVTHVSPKNVRKSPAIATTAPTPTTPSTTSIPRRRMSNNSNGSTEATRFHEFASSDDEPEEWVQESTCHRSRLTVTDTLKKENIIRKACEEVEEEVIAEEDEEDEEVLEDDANGEDDELDDDENTIDDDEEEDESDDGFHTDDEEGFAESDSEGEESDEEWWRPGGISTAATSIDHLDRLTLNRQDDTAASSSVDSAASQVSPRRVMTKSRRKHHANGMDIVSRPDLPVDLPDSTDFVCGTLDEDRPLEQAYLNQKKAKEAAKRKARPQDIDPTFPTSDPELDEEDDDDLADPEESQREHFMHGDLDELDGDLTAHRKRSPHPRARSNVHRSPPPPVATRRRSPAPGAMQRQNTTRSPAPPTRRVAAGSPAPGKLCGQSPRRSRSPAPIKRMTSPLNTRPASPSVNTIVDTNFLASRPQATQTASLPRDGYFTGAVNAFHMGEDEDLDEAGKDANGEKVPRRGAIDIFKGLEKKRQRRKEKLYQKACAKAAAKGEKAYKVKPGRGAERMREVGLELQRYHGKGEHILSM